jgi:hypothetical protein
MGTFSITTYNKQLVILYNSEEGDEIQLSSITFFNPSVEVKGNKFSFFESGTYKKSISFKEIYLINDVEPTDSEDAFNKIIEGIANFNRGGAAPYKVYTALLTQIGGDDPQTWSSGSGPLILGVTYQIEVNDGGSGWDFTNVGAPNNNVGTYFVATGTTPNSWGTNGMLSYNTGAPVVTVLENTIGDIRFEYGNTGSYAVWSNSLFTIDKSTMVVGGPTWDGGTGYFSYGFDGDSLGFIISRDFSNSYLNDNLKNTFLEIRVYN